MIQRRRKRLNKIILSFLLLLLSLSCQKKHSDDRSQDEVIIEFAARLEEHSPEYQYDHTEKSQPVLKK